MVYTLRFFSSKCSLFHHSNLFGSCIIHILYTGCAKIKKIFPVPKVKQNFLCNFGGLRGSINAVQNEWIQLFLFGKETHSFLTLTLHLSHLWSCNHICIFGVSRIKFLYCSRLFLKCDGTRSENKYRLPAKGTNPFKSAGASVHPTTGSRGVRISGSNAGYTMFRGSVKSTGYPLHSPVSPSLPLPCVTVCHHISTGV